MMKVSSSSCVDSENKCTHACTHEDSVRTHLCYHNSLQRGGLVVTDFSRTSRFWDADIFCQIVLKSLIFHKKYFKIHLEKGIARARKGHSDLGIKNICEDLKRKFIKRNSDFFFETSRFGFLEELNAIFDNFYLLFSEFVTQLDESVDKYLIDLKKECEKNLPHKKDKINLLFTDGDIPKDFCSYFDQCIGTRMLASFNKTFMNGVKKFMPPVSAEIAKEVGGSCVESLRSTLGDSINKFCEKMKLDFSEINNWFSRVFSRILVYIPFKFFDICILEDFDINNPSKAFPILRSWIVKSKYLSIFSDYKEVFENASKKFQDIKRVELSSFRYLAQTSLNGETRKESSHMPTYANTSNDKAFEQSSVDGEGYQSCQSGGDHIVLINTDTNDDNTLNDNASEQYVVYQQDLSGDGVIEVCFTSALEREIVEPGIDSENLEREEEFGINGENLKRKIEEPGIDSENLKREMEVYCIDGENRVKIRKQNEWESESRHNVANSDPSYNLIQPLMVEPSFRNINRVAF